MRLSVGVRLQNMARICSAYKWSPLPTFNRREGLTALGESQAWAIGGKNYNCPLLGQKEDLAF